MSWFLKSTERDRWSKNCIHSKKKALWRTIGSVANGLDKEYTPPWKQGFIWRFLRSTGREVQCFNWSGRSCVGVFRYSQPVSLEFFFWFSLSFAVTCLMLSHHCWHLKDSHREPIQETYKMELVNDCKRHTVWRIVSYKCAIYNCMNDIKNHRYKVFICWHLVWIS